MEDLILSVADSHFFYNDLEVSWRSRFNVAAVYQNKLNICKSHY